MPYFGPSGPKKISYLFVDGASFDNIVGFYAEELFKIDKIPIDYSKLLSVEFDKVFFHDYL